MSKFSIIIPVYNSEKYIKRCLDSIKNQTFQDYEVIIINDGSHDQSKDIISQYLSSKKFKYYEQDNMGISYTRNRGIELSKGDYIVFLDSDDCIYENMLEIVNKNIDKSIDILKFQYEYVYDDHVELVNDNFEIEDSGEKVLLKLIQNQCNYEAPWMYIYNKNYMKKNRFRYEEGICHEDFALTPYILIKAAKVKVISNCLYKYMQVDNSITRNDNYERIYKNVYDMYKGFKINYFNINNNGDLSSEFKKIFNSYLANIVIKKGLDLNKKDQKEYYNNLKKDMVYNLLLDDTFKRKIKKFVIKINPKLYYNFFK